MKWKTRPCKFVDLPSDATCLPEETHWLVTTITNCPRAEQNLLNRSAKNITYCVATIYITWHHITSHHITLHFWAFLRFFSRIHIFSRLYNLPPRQAFWSSRTPDSLAIRNDRHSTLSKWFWSRNYLWISSEWFGNNRWHHLFCSPLR